ncbi:MAG TPA: hypothetical protein PLE45_10395 [Spirochaetota bacterium]|nr:hypothetical protein [Spirochaetota bacterium]HOL57538.1 hypothetical protein [Spirochaetota bacterium]HPP05103.1 hypothetical protein [Spirochaetota bacterium]
MKRFLLLFLFIFQIITLHAIKFKIDKKDSTDDKITIMAIFDTGFGVEGINDGIGITDYQSFFFRPAFHIEDFGIGLDLTIRFRIFTQQPEFRVKDWYIENDPLSTLFLYLDKIAYIKYGDLNKPIYFTTGRLPFITLGNSLLVKNYHNIAFYPTSKENGLFFKFNANYLNFFKKDPLPIELTFFIPDLLDPDIFGFDFTIDTMKFTIHDDMSLKFGLSFMSDFDANEHNRLSALPLENLQDYRNIQYDGWTTSLIGLSIPIFYSFERENFKLIFSNESAFLLDLPNIPKPDNFNFGFGNRFEFDSRFLNIKKSGFLLGASAGFIVTASKFQIDYFSSTYELVRKKMYYTKYDDYEIMLSWGFGIYAFKEELQFKFKMTIPVTVDSFYSKFESQFTLSSIIVKGLFINVFYETGVNPINIQGSNGGHFIESITKDFRFYAEVGYQIYNAKINFLIGVQRPGWIDENNYIDPNTLELNPDNYGADLQKFISLEVSFVL